MNECFAAEKKLASLTDEPQEVTVEASKTFLDQCKGVVDNITRSIRAAEINSQIVVNQFIIDVLNIDGLRKQKLATAVTEFNSLLADISEHADWPLIQLDIIDLAPRYGGRLMAFITPSEQFRVNVSLQVALAVMDGSQLLVIDAADVLDAEGRNGLFAVLDRVADTVPSVVTMTVSSRDAVPMLDDLALGLSYWVDGGVATEVRHAAAAA